MLQTVVAISMASLCLSLGFSAVAVAWRLVGWWRLREVRRSLAEADTLEQTRAYVAWVRNMPPPPVRPRPLPAIPGVPVAPPVRGVLRPFPGRRRMAGR